MKPFFALTMFVVSTTFGQSFEVVSITPCAPDTPLNGLEHAGMVQLVFPGRFQARADTPKYLMEWAYGIQPTQHSKGPEWFEAGCFDVTAKPEDAAAGEAEMRGMLRTLLAQRFELRFHVEKRDLPVYVFRLGKNAPKLTPVREGDTHAMQMSRRTGADGKVTGARVVGTRFTVAQLADVFARQFDRPIVDRTGVQGEFNFTMDLTADETRPNLLDVTLLLTALQEELGLPVKAERAEVDYYVIDGVSRGALGN